MTKGRVELAVIRPSPEAEPAPRPVTARPVGVRFAVTTRGLAHRVGTWPMRDGRTAPEEEVSDNFVEMDAGCFRRLPTCGE